MVIYGWASKKLKKAPFTGNTCSNCQSETTLVIVSASYAHIFWIPLFPFKKNLRIVCTNCKHEEKAKDASEEVKVMAKQLKASVSSPWYLFSGSILAVLIIGFFTIQGKLQRDKLEAYIESPEVNDVYTLFDPTEPTQYKYYLWKVIEVNGDSINVSPASFQYPIMPSSLDPEDGFYDVYFTYHKSFINELYQMKELKSIKRGVNDRFDRSIEYTQDTLDVGSL